MVGMTNSNSREKYLSLVYSVKAAINLPSKLEYLRRLKQALLDEENALLISEIIPCFFDLFSDSFAPVRKFATEVIGEVGLKHVQLVPEIVPVLISVLDDATPAVARQAITSGLDLFRFTLEKVAIQGLHSSDLDSSLESSWEWMLKFKDKVYSIAFQPGGGGVRLLALKFVEAVILLYTPDPNGSLKPPSDEENLVEFNISWLRGCHPLLNVGDLSIEASEKLGLLLDQLRSPTVKSLSSLVVVVLINSLSAIARKRPPYYGRILPVLLGLDPPTSVIEGMHISGPQHALKNALLACLKCTHPGASPWRDRLAGALKEMEAGDLAENALKQFSKANGNVEEKDDMPAKEEKPSNRTCDVVQSNLGRKRSGADDGCDLEGDDDVSGKRARPTPGDSEALSQDHRPSTGSTSNKGNSDSGPVQQLVAMFGALVAQGEKAVSSLEILISSISADLLAEVVMANMCNLPPFLPQAEGDEESVLNMSIVGSDTGAKYPASFVANVLSLSSSFPPVASLLDVHQPISSDIGKLQKEEELHAADGDDGASVDDGISHVAGNAMLPPGSLANSDVLPVTENADSAVSAGLHAIGNIESDIPGLSSSGCNDGFSETLVASSSATTDLEDASQEQVTSGRSPLDLPSVSTDRSDELSSKAAITDTQSLISSTATSVSLPSHFVLPKMSAPVVELSDEQKDQLQKLSYIRIVEAYKQIAVAGGSQIRLSLLASLGVEFPSELEPWKLLQEHILSDYVNHEGHELTLRVLYRLFGEAEEEHDFFSSTTAASAYEMFLLTVAETLRDSFPPTDKSLSRLLGEVPYLPKSVLKLLEGLCLLGSFDKGEKELQSGDRVTQGLSAVWSLILLRPPLREDCLKIALLSAVHCSEEVRMKAIRLVANKLYPLSSIAQQIEDFAQERLLSTINGDGKVKKDAEVSTNGPQKDSDLEKPSNELMSGSTVGKDISSDIHQSSTSPSMSSLSIPEAQRCMSLYFALCTKKHSLFRKIFILYKDASNVVKQAVQRHIPILVRTIGSSSELLEIISDPPGGSESLLMQVLHTLTDGTIPSPELIFTIKKLYDSKLKDVEILFPILPFLPGDEILVIFPHLVSLPQDKFQAALARILQGSSNSGPVLSPAEVLIAIHGIDPDKDGIPLKKVTDACNACFEQRQIFTQQVLAKVLNQLVEQIPLPLLFMRTVLQAIGAFPALVDFIMEILSRLITKQIWKYPKLWVGFLKCAQLTQPQSFNVLLQLPPPQLENALNRISALKAPLVAHASQPNIRSSLPRSVLAVLGIALDTQTSSQAQTSQAQTSQGQTGDISNSEKEAVTEKSKEESSVAS
ncbi:HEAT repeat-containing protein [Citrus sinensis]|uniref:HEAT repeat-containing protein n=1 Tax=Citrus sinensis TaxID=2711 RepID=A0ACB8JVI6_CITSI|nr:HEAT repeat-containing protein [Citrus sinensis]